MKQAARYSSAHPTVGRICLLYKTALHLVSWQQPFPVALDLALTPAEVASDVEVGRPTADSVCELRHL